MKLNEVGGNKIYYVAGLPEGVPDEDWQPLNRSDLGLEVILRIYVPDLEHYEF
jgi:hypothetical protein